MSPTHRAALLPLCVCYQRLRECSRRYVSALFRYGVDTLLSGKWTQAKCTAIDETAAQTPANRPREAPISTDPTAKVPGDERRSAAYSSIAVRLARNQPPLPPAPPRQRGGERVALCRQGCRDEMSLHPCLEREALRIASRAFAA
mgnify:CR=1 FL=1